MDRLSNGGVQNARNRKHYKIFVKPQTKLRTPGPVQTPSPKRVSKKDETIGRPVTPFITTNAPFISTISIPTDGPVSTPKGLPPTPQSTPPEPYTHTGRQSKEINGSYEITRFQNQYTDANKKKERETSDLHKSFLRWFDDKLKWETGQSFDDILEKAAEQYRFDSCGEGGSTLLHTIIKTDTKRLSKYKRLIAWLMKKYPEQYKKRDLQDYTILDWALDPAHEDDTRIDFLMCTYPEETAYLVLHDKQKEEAFFQFIVPNIGKLLFEHYNKKSGHKWDFGPLKKSLGNIRPLAELALRCPDYVDPTIVKVRVDLLITHYAKELAEFILDEKTYIMPFIVPSLFNEKSRKLCLELFKKPTDTSEKRKDTTPDEKVPAKNSMTRDFASKSSSSMSVENEFWPCDTRTGNTLLHCVVEHRCGTRTIALVSHETAIGTSPDDSKINPSEIMWQRDLVEKVYDSCPSALTKKNKDGMSPYQFRISSPVYLEWAKARKTLKQRKSVNSLMFDDEITVFLKDKILHLDREVALHHLRYNNQDREIHLDLRELPYLDYSVSKTQIDTLIKSLKFESILQYVHIPRQPFKIQDNLPTGEDDPTDRRGAGRVDFDIIFKALRNRGVGTILRLIVDDDDTTPHTDEFLVTNVLGFSIEEWHWAKTDLSSEVLCEVAKDVRKITLYSSGNSAVLHGWSASDGLCALKKLEEVHLIIRWRLEGWNRVDKYAKQFHKRMMESFGSRKLKLNIKIEKACISKGGLMFDEKENMAPGAWLGHICGFLGFISEAKKKAKREPDPIRIAILDDGYDAMDKKLNKSVAAGHSFFVRASASSEPGSFKLANPYYCSTTGHGTVMARLVLSVCPEAKLYIARLDQGQSQSGSLTPTIESAAQAIDWAVDKGVHIISMSFTFSLFKKPGDPMTVLEHAIERAANAGIIMFGAASDQGYNDNSRPYPGASHSVICIGAALESGHAEGKSEKDGNYFFPGNPQGIQVPQDRRNNPVVLPGSSVATAFASGLAALIIYCAQLSECGKPYRKIAQTRQGMENILGRIADLTVGSDGRAGPRRYVGVHGSFNGKLGDKTWEEGRVQFETDISRIFANLKGENEIM